MFECDLARLQKPDANTDTCLCYATLHHRVVAVGARNSREGAF
jgi:hypothetical protein